MTSNDAERPDDQPRPSGAFPGAPDVESVFPEGQAPSGEPGDGSAGAPAPGAAVRSRRRWSFAREVGVIVVAALVISFLIKTFVVQPFVIPSESMENTLIKDDRVLASRFVPRFLDIHRGDVVVFKDPGGGG
ncbi:signal peptidase I, partial [Oerskovia merdavium]